MTVTWLKKGKEAKEAVKKIEEAAALRKAQNDKTQRFWLKSGSETNITFVDGDLDEDGVLIMPYLEEHTTNIPGQWDNYICVADEEPCPICEMEGQKGAKPDFVAVLTIIDHSVWTDKDGNKHKDEKKLFVMKHKTQKVLQRIATKRGGLSGCSFEVARSEGKMIPRVGDLFDFEEKISHKKMVKKYGKEMATPFNYEKELEYRDADALRELGFGHGGKAVGADDSSGKKKKKKKGKKGKKDYSGDM